MMIRSVLLTLYVACASASSTVIVTFMDDLPVGVGNGSDSSQATAPVAGDDIPGVRLVADLPYLGEAIYEGLSDSQDVDDVCDVVMMYRNIETCEPDSSGTIDQISTPNDLAYPAQAYLNTTGVVTLWQQNIFGNKNIRIGIIDSGVDLLNPDLAPSLWTNPNPDDNDGVPDDVHCASFIGGVASGNCSDMNG